MNQNLTKQFIDKWNGSLPTVVSEGDVMKMFGINKD